jgi:hypothetical protein
VNPQDSGSPDLITYVFLQHRLDEGSLKFRYRLTVEDVAVYQSAHKRSQFHGVRRF